jgi:hypothetical protein
MHIIFGKENARALENKYTVLELDTFDFKDKELVVPAYCIIENISINELPKLEDSKKLHQELINGYGSQKWDFCLETISLLIGCWGGEVDTFYQDLRSRINKLKASPPGNDWSPVILKLNPTA